MGRTLDEMIESLTPAQRTAVERRADVLIGQEYSVRERRTARNPSHRAMAKRLKKGIHG